MQVLWNFKVGELKYRRPLVLKRDAKRLAITELRLTPEWIVLVFLLPCCVRDANVEFEPTRQQREPVSAEDALSTFGPGDV